MRAALAGQGLSIRSGDSLNAARVTVAEGEITWFGDPLLRKVHATPSVGDPSTVNRAERISGYAPRIAGEAERASVLLGG